MGEKNTPQGQNLTQEEIDKLVNKLLKEKTATAKSAKENKERKE